MYKILVCGLTSNLGGIEKVILNFYQYMDKEKFHLDFINLGEGKVGFSERFEELSPRPIKYYNLPKRGKNPLEFKQKLEQIFKEHASEYDVIWVNLCMLSNIEYLKLAKKYGIKRRIVHSHNSSDADKGIRKVLHGFNRYKVGSYATDFWACSDEAARWFYTPKIVKKYKFIRNAIDIESFLFDDNKRKKIRENFDLKDTDLLIGHVGRMSVQKNQEFALKVFAEVVKKMTNAKLIFVGGGDDRHLREEAKELGVEDKVIFAGLRDDVADFYNAFDFFCFPSRYEGLPVTLLEAQANGLPILACDIITKQVVVNNNLYYLSLDAGSVVWAEKIVASLKRTKRIDKNEIKENFLEKGFILEEETRRIERLFLEGEKL